MKAAVLGATGFIGRALAPELAGTMDVVAMSRRGDAPGGRRIEPIAADATNAKSVRRAFDGVDVVYYLVHSLGATNFSEVDRKAAATVADEAARAGASQIVFLGGFGDGESDLSPHLRSRAETARILRDGPVPVTTLRAAVVLGRGSAAFDTIVALVDRLPAMVAPRWVSMPTQPIALDDVIGYLRDVAGHAETLGETFDLGGPDVLTYRQMIESIGALRGRRPRIVEVPVLSPRLSSYWLHLVTPVARERRASPSRRSPQSDRRPRRANPTAVSARADLLRTRGAGSPRRLGRLRERAPPGVRRAALSPRRVETHFAVELRPFADRSGVAHDHSDDAAMEIIRLGIAATLRELRAAPGTLFEGTVNRTRIGPTDCECIQRIAATCGESPMWSVREQALYWTDNLGGRIHRLEPESGRDESFVLGENVMSIGLREGGGLVLALAKQLAFYEPASELELLVGVEHDQPRNRFNDGKVDRRGRYWAGTMNDIDWDEPSGSLYRVDPGLDLSRLQGAVVCANGLGWSPDDRTFYFGESFRYAIFAYDFDPDAGTLSARRVFATVDRSSGAFPDGLTVDAEGGVWSVQNGAGRLLRYAPDGGVTHEVEVPLPQPTSCIFGGRDLDVLYITTSRQNMTPEELGRYPLSGSVFAVRPGLSGLPEPLFAR